jgi:serine phosphatase RsbU (regulator of sigma subunit)
MNITYHNMKKNQTFRLPESLFSSPSITNDEITEASGKVKSFTHQEIERIRGGSVALSFAREENTVLSNFSQLIPVILMGNNLSIQKFGKHCRSCIITESEVFEIAGIIHQSWMDGILEAYPDKEVVEEKFSDFVPFERLPKNLIRLYIEYVYIIPVILKKAGYEIIRKSEVKFINTEMAEKLVRIIHSKYRKSMGLMQGNSRNIYQEMYQADKNSSQYTSDFEGLSEDARSSNIDNVFHIPTKLLSIGYRIVSDPDPEFEIPLLDLSHHEVETMARIEHDRWSWERRLSGWKYGRKRNNGKKLHDCLVPFDELSEEEKEKDRIMVRLIPHLLKDIGFSAVPVLPEESDKIGYVKRDWGCISELKTAFGRLKSMMPEELAYKAKTELSDVDTSIENIKSSFAFGKQVQASFLCSFLEFKVHLPDSFVLYKPKDIVSGDFYFISKQNSSVIISAADCTGHGISAAIITAVCYNYLDIAVNKKRMVDPASILRFVIPRIEDFFSHNQLSAGNNFGMDFNICSLDVNSNILHFAGFGNPLYYYADGALKVIKGISSFSKFDQVKKLISTSEIQLMKGDTFYIFSDGFADQEGEGGKRFQLRRFRELLTDIQKFSVHDQSEKLNQTIEEWRRSSDIGQSQTDDILVIGVKI